ncbi:hypothetical protein JCM11641_006562 [Rhodosporidiobolus odoratus]
MSMPLPTSSSSRGAKPAPPGSGHPPGTMLNPDGTVCKPCTAFRSWAGIKKKTPSNPSSFSSSSTSAAGASTLAATAAATSAASLSSSSDELPRDCPPDVNRLGRHTWTFLHSTASYFPPLPSTHQKTSMLSLLHSLPTLYPCGDCAGHLGKYMEKNPPEKAVEKGREALEKWLCEVHNEVNERLGKERFVCEEVPQRWREGWKDGRCE